MAAGDLMISSSFALSCKYPSPDGQHTSSHWFYVLFLNAKRWGEEEGERGGGADRKKKVKGGTSESSQKMAHYEWWERERRRAAAMASVFNLEPGERLCSLPLPGFLCFSRICTRGARGGGSRRGRQVNGCHAGARVAQPDPG